MESAAGMLKVVADVARLLDGVNELERTGSVMR